MLRVNARIQIPDSELQFSFARSSGPGGQNVNKVNSKAILRWSVGDSHALPADVRQRFLTRYRNRLTSQCELILRCQRFRDQGRNVDDCLERLRAMIVGVASAPRKRRATQPTRGSVERRLRHKQKQGQKKRLRGGPADD